MSGDFVVSDVLSFSGKVYDLGIDCVVFIPARWESIVRALFRFCMIFFRYIKLLLKNGFNIILES